MSNTYAEKVGIREVFGGNKKICNFFVFLIHSSNQLWVALLRNGSTPILPPSHRSRGIKDWDW